MMWKLLQLNLRIFWENKTAQLKFDCMKRQLIRAVYLIRIFFSTIARFSLHSARFYKHDRPVRSAVGINSGTPVTNVESVDLKFDRLAC